MKTYDCHCPNLELSIIIKSEMLTIHTDIAMTTLAMLILVLLTSQFCL